MDLKNLLILATCKALAAKSFEFPYFTTDNFRTNGTQVNSQRREPLDVVSSQRDSSQ